MIAHFLRARDLDRALTMTNLLYPSDDCTAVDDGLTGVLEWVLPSQDSLRDRISRASAIAPPV